MFLENLFFKLCTKFSYHKNYLRYKVPFLNVVKCSWKLQLDHLIFFGFSEAQRCKQTLFLSRSPSTEKSKKYRSN